MKRFQFLILRGAKLVKNTKNIHHLRNFFMFCPHYVQFRFRANSNRVPCKLKSSSVQTHVIFRANSPAADTILGRCANQTQNIIDILTNSIDIFENSIDISTNIIDILSFFGTRSEIGGQSW